MGQSTIVQSIGLPTVSPKLSPSFFYNRIEIELAMNKKLYTKIVLTVLSVIGIGIVVYYAWNFKTFVWKGVIFPGGCENSSETCLMNRIGSPEYQSLQQCKEWAVRGLATRNNSDDTYVCLLNCRITADGKGQLCNDIVHGETPAKVR